MKEFKVAAVSSNRNAFGLKGMILVAQDGEAWQVGANDLNVRKVGEVIRGEGSRSWTGYGFEIPERLSQAPPGVVREVWKKDFKGITFLFNAKQRSLKGSCEACGKYRDLKKYVGHKLCKECIAFFHGKSLRRHPRMLFNMKKCENPAAKCVMCSGPLVSLGSLGAMHWYRCRNCGMDQSRKSRARRKAVKRNPYGRSFTVYCCDCGYETNTLKDFHRHQRKYRHGGPGLERTERVWKRGFPVRSRRNPIESTPGGGFMVTGQATQLYRLLALKHAMKLELTTGLKMSRGISPFKIVKQEFGFKGNKQKIYDQLVAHIEKVGPGLAKNPGPILNGIKYWYIKRWNELLGRMDHVGKVKATYRQIKHYFPGAPVRRIDKLVGEVCVMKKSQARIPARVRK